MAVHKVENLNKVNATKYIEGDIFITKSSVAILANGKLKTISFNRGLTKSEVQKMIDDSQEKGGKKDGL